MPCSGALRLFILVQEVKMFAFITILLLCPFIFCPDAAYVDNFTKCSVKDDQCMKEMFQKAVRDIGEAGIPELNIDPIDPIRLTDISVTILDGLIITLTEGSIKGFKNCNVNRISVDLDKEVIKEEFLCDILTIKGHFTFGGSSEVVKSFFGSDSVNGNGKIKMKLEKASMKIDLPVAVVKKDDGRIYLKLNTTTKFNYDLQKATFDVKNLIIGGNDLSEIANTYLNSDWKTIVKSFGNDFVKEGIIYVLLHVQGIYDVMSIDHFILEDLTEYVKN